MTLAEELRALAEDLHGRRDGYDSTVGELCVSHKKAVALADALLALAARAEREQAEAVDAATSHIIGPAGPVRLDASDDPDGCTITLYDEGKPVTRIGLSEWRRLEREQSPEREAFVKGEKWAWLIYECARLEAIASQRPIVPEPWRDRDSKFRDQMMRQVGIYLDSDVLPTPEEAHDSWWRAYEKMGWSWGPVRDVAARTHPDMVPFADLPKSERDKDEVFLLLVEVAKRIRAMLAVEEKRK